MTPDRFPDILLALDPDTRPAGNGGALTIKNAPVPVLVIVIVDPAADRMRAGKRAAVGELHQRDDHTGLRLRHQQQNTFRGPETCAIRPYQQNT